MEENESRERSHLFMVRVWSEDLGQGQTEWRGKIQHIGNGEVRYFRDWTTLTTFLPEMLHAAAEHDESFIDDREEDLGKG